MLITGGIGVVAITMNANQIKYTPSNEKFTATNVKEAIDEIYKIAEYEIPADTYFYDSETEGENIVRYKKVDGKYYLCDGNGKIINDAEQDISSIILTEYIGSNQNTLSIGNAAYVDNNFVLGSNNPLTGSDVIYDVINLGNAREINITDIVGAENIGKYSVDDFISLSTSYTLGSIWDPWETNGNLYHTHVSDISLSYNPATGILNITGGVYNFKYVISNTTTVKYENNANYPVITYLKVKTPL